MYPGYSIFSKVTRFFTIAVLFLALTSCGGGSGGGGTGFSAGGPPLELDGTWSGSLQDPTGALHTYTVTISAGVITQILIDAADQNLTGTITKESDSLYSLTLSDGTVAGFIVDAATLHAAFVDDAFNFGVVQKGAAGLPTFLVNDTGGNWVGDTVVTDFVVFAEFTSTATCVNLSCTAIGNGVISNVELSGFFSADFGLWQGIFTNDVGESGVTTVMLSPDKQFAASHACDKPGFFPNDCDFSAWVKR